MSDVRFECIRQLFEESNGILKSAQLKKNKYSDRDIQELLNEGHIKKIRNGFYGWNDIVNKLCDYKVANLIFPNSIVSVLSAASIHELTTVNPMSICLTIPSNSMKPKLPDYPPIDLFYINEKHIELGAQKKDVDGFTINIYNIERTICDLFKYTKRVDKEVALEALKRYMNMPNRNIQLLLEYATTVKVKKVIKPYVEALL